LSDGKPFHLVVETPESNLVAGMRWLLSTYTNRLNHRHKLVGHEPLRRGWCLGGEAFRKEMLERMEGQLGQSHAGELKRESAEVRAERIIAEELKRQGWSEAQLRQRRKSDPVKLALAARLRRETILTVGWIARRLEMGTRQSVATRLQEQKKTPRKR
jgi:hypothetical protein